MNYIKLILISLLLSSCATTDEAINTTSSGKNPLEQSNDEKIAYDKALTFLNNENLTSAKEIFLQISDARPELAGPHANLAIIALKNKNPERARELIKVALTKNPRFAQALNLLAYLEQISGKIKSAEKHYKEAIENKNDYAIAHYNLALLYDVYFQDIGKAIPHYEKYMELINNKDKNTADWLEQIKRKTENG